MTTQKIDLSVIVALKRKRRETRAAAANLRQRYARHFKLPLEEVELEEFTDDWVAFAKNNPELPQWSLGYNEP